MKLNKASKYVGTVVAILSLIIFLITLDTHDAIDQQQAIKIAELKLAEFIKKREIVESEFGKPDIRADGDGWIIHYEGVAKNNLLIAVSIGRTGGSEIHFTTK